MTTILENVVEAAEDIQAKRDQLVSDADKLNDIVNGPSSGTGSTTTVLAKVANDFGTLTGDFTNGGGLAAARDGITDQAVAAAAARSISHVGYDNVLQFDWGVGNTKTIGRIRIFAPNDTEILENSTGTTFKLEGSADGSIWTPLYTAPVAVGALGEVIDIDSGIIVSTAYRHHRVNFSGDGTNRLAVAELELYEIKTVKSAAKVIADAEATLLSAWPAPVGFGIQVDTGATAGDPGAGYMRFGAANQDQSTTIRFSKTDYFGLSNVAQLNVLTASDNNTIKSYLKIVKLGDRAKSLLGAVTAVADQTTYVDVTIAFKDNSGVAGNPPAEANPFADDDVVLVSVIQVGNRGNAGIDGAGAGDVQSDDDPTTIDKILGFISTDKHVVGQDFAKLLAGRSHSGGDINTFGPWSNVATAAAADIGGTNTVFVNLTGTDTVSSFGTEDNWLRICKVQDGFTVSRNATTLEVPNQSDVTFVAGDIFIATRDSSLGAGRAQIIAISKADGRAYRGPNDIPQNIALSGVLSPAQITANQNDYAPTGHGTVASLRLSTDASRTISGLAGGASGRVVTVENVGSNPIILSDADANSTAANRFSFGQNLTLAAKNGAVLKYDATESRWKLLAVSLSFGALALLNRITNIDQNLTLTGRISPTQISANTNDWAPTGFSTCSVIRVSTDASRNLTGLAGGADGRLILLLNVGSNNLVLKNEDSNSTAANRFSAGGDRTLAGGDGAILWYDSTSSRWRVLSVLPGVGGGSGTTVPATNGGRLSAATGVREHTTAVTAATSIYWGPFNGAYVALYDGSTSWNYRAITEKSIKLTDAQTGETHNGTAVIDNLTDTSQLVAGMLVSGTGVGTSAAIVSVDSATQITVSVNSTANGTNTITFKCPKNTGYDVYAKDVSGAPKLFMFARAALFTPTTNTTQDGVVVKSGDTTMRHVGAFRTSNTDGQVDYALSGQYRFSIWNQDNRLYREHCEAFPASGANTWYRSMATMRIKSDIAGGSGAGGTWNLGNSSSGGAGGSGGRSIKNIFAASLGATETVTVGAAGGTTSFGAHHSATGGGNGSNGTSSDGAIGADGAGSSGDFNFTGGGPVGGAGGGTGSYAGRKGWAVVDEILEI